MSPPTAFTRSIVSATLSVLRSTAKIFAPSWAKRTAVARPLPQPGPTLPAPVIMAILSLRRPAISLPPWRLSLRQAETIEPLRVVDQQRGALRLAWCDLAQQIDQFAVVGNRPLVVRMRPVEAPDRSVARCFDEPARKGHRVGIRWALAGDTVGAADLDPDVAVVEQAQQCLEVRLIEAERGVDAAHVVDHHRRRRTMQRCRKLGDEIGFHVDLQMPAEAREALAKGDHVIDRGRLLEMPHIVEAR